MSIKLKIILFISILIIVSLGAILWHLSFKQYKPVLAKEIESRISVQFDSISKPVGMRILLEKGSLKDLFTSHKIFQENPEILYVSVMDSNKRVISILIRNLIIFKEGKKQSIAYRVEEIKSRYGKVWNKKNEFIYLNVMDLKELFSKEYKEIHSINSNVKVLVDINKELFKRKRLDKTLLKESFKKTQRYYNIVKHLTEDKYKLYQNKLFEIFTASKGLKLDGIKNIYVNVKGCKDDFDSIKGFKFKVSKKKAQIGYLREYTKYLNMTSPYMNNIERRLKSIIKYGSKFEVMRESRLVMPLYKKYKEENIFKEVTIEHLLKDIQFRGKVAGYYDIGISVEAINKKINPIILSGMKSSLIIFVLSLISAIILALYIIYPINVLEKGADEIKRDLTYKIKLKRKDEFGKFAETFNDLSGQLTEELRKYHKLYKEATEDELTKLMVRRYFMETLKQELENASKEGRVTSLLMTDIDHFKKFNDTYGHQTGDIVLSKVAGILLKNTRKNRVRSDVAGRYGGEEFAVLLPDTNKEEALQVAERIRKEVEAMRFKSTKGDILQVTISIGVASSDGQKIKPEELIARADMALYNSKETGRNRVSYA